MNRRRTVALTALGISLLLSPTPEKPLLANEEHPGPVEEKGPPRYPSDWFLRQRAWPYDDVKQASRLEAHAQATVLRDLARGSGTASWEPVGPTNVGGRVADLACHPTNSNIVWVGAASGGVFKTTDAGATWIPTFDDQSALSIGSVAIDPNDPDVVYIGTGEPNGGGGSVTYGGTGVFKTTNGGVTWTNLGLVETRFIGRVRIDPSNSNRVFVAALGSQWSPSSDRGVYRSIDAGASWERVLASTDSTGAVDLLIHPTDSNRIYAAMWERSRGPDYLNYGGPTSGLFRSTDGGDTWQELTNGLPTTGVGRIGIAISESSPSTLYAIHAEDNPGAFLGVFKSTNGGDTWTQTNDGALGSVYSSYGWWFGNIRVDPADPNRVFVLGLDFYRTTNGGSSWSFAAGSMHVDHHALDFAANGHIWEGNDGGVYRSTNGGTIWSHLANLPITQFYTVEVDEQLPERRYGGTQDNGTNRTLTGAPNDWTNIFWGDGFRCLVDPISNSFVYAESQYGNLVRSTNGGFSFTSATTGLNGRKNWSMPVEFDPTNSSTLYAGTHLLHRSTNRAVSWSAISPDLTSGDQGVNTVFGTITTVAVSPTDPGVILVGADDGNVSRTSNGGTTWTNVSGALPTRWITRVAFDPGDAAIAYVTISGFRWDEPLPHVFRTTDLGATWTDISGNLPEAPVNDIIVDHDVSSTLYVGTDFGTYITTNVGSSWSALGVGLPNVVVSDLELHQPTRTLIAGTYGRSQWTFDLDALTTVGVDLVESAGLKAPRLLPLLPNPSRGSTVSVRYALPRAAHVTVDVYDVAGRRVATLAEGEHAAGTHDVAWEGRDDAGRRVTAGVYLVRLAGDGVTRLRKLTRLE